MKKILGLDLGVGSIGWAYIAMEEGDKPRLELLGQGSRIVPLSVDETTGFTRGNGETPCAARTLKRSIRRGMDRYQQRRLSLAKILNENGMNFGNDLLALDPMTLWQLRADAASGLPLRLDQIGRVIYHMNQRRGYKPAKGDMAENEKSDYLSLIRGRVAEAEAQHLTPGQFFALKLKNSEYTTSNGCKAYSYRIKEQVFPRTSYENEMRAILQAQAKHHPDVLTPQLIENILGIVFYQRPLKSCKHLVSICEFEAREITTPDGKKKVVGPHVAAATSPLAQVCRMWEAINNISLKNYRNKRRKANDAAPDLFGYSADRRSMYQLTPTNDERLAIFRYLDDNEALTTKALLKIMRLSPEDGFATDRAVTKGIKGNETKNALRKAIANLPNAEDLLRFNISYTETADPETGEVCRIVSSDYLREPLYQLWHTVYSIDDFDHLRNTLASKFGITDPDTVDRLFKLDFRGKGYANKSAKFMCRLIPFLEEGFQYSEACEMAGVNHSGSLTKAQNQARQLLDELPLLPKGALRQPVVEKILNQLIHQVNAISLRFGKPDEIRIELARSLKQSKDERADTSKRNNAREKENIKISEKILNEFAIRPTVNKIQKYRMWEESEHCCMYCGNPVGAREFLMGIDAKKEHVIPRSLFFDDSFSNKVCSCRKCNAAKGQMTGYDFMAAQGDRQLSQYVDRVERLFAEYKKSKGARGISKTKHDRLLTPATEIPQDFIERDLRQSQYIARKAMEILRLVCRDVYATSGAVTDFFRHAWGYDEILHSLNLRRYSDAGQTELVSFEHKGQSHTEERIKGWTKRLDHRHHAIDALVIALTRQSYIQRLNTLNAQRDAANAPADAQSPQHRQNMQNLEKWAQQQPHFSFEQARSAVSTIAVSFKSGKKVATPGKRIVYKGGRRIVAQQGLIVPRGPLTEESVYGKIRLSDRQVPVKKLFERVADIANLAVRDAVSRRLQEFAGDVRKARASLKKQPLTVNGLSIEAADCWRHEVVIRYKVDSIKYKNIDDIVDSAVRQAIRQRFAEVDNDDKLFVKSLAESPVYRDPEHHFPIKTVRCFTGLALSSVTPVYKDPQGLPIGFAKFGNNHHIALYVNPDGDLEELVVPMAHAVARKRLGLPVIATDPAAVWDSVNLLGLEDEEELLSRMPMPGWTFFQSLQVNDMFLLGLSDEEIEFLHANGRQAELCVHLFRVQKLSSMSYDFKRHDSTVSDTQQAQIENGDYIRIKSLGRYRQLNPRKVSITRTGQIII